MEEQQTNSTRTLRTWPLASYTPVERRTGEPDRREEERSPDRRRRMARALRSLLRL